MTQAGAVKPDVDLLLARAQVWIAIYFITGIFGIVFALMFLHTTMSPIVVTILTSTLTALVTILTLQSNFFYARSRPAALPDPTTTTTTTTTTTAPTAPADGASLVPPLTTETSVKTQVPADSPQGKPA
jgi:hypothetical protein